MNAKYLQLSPSAEEERRKRSLRRVSFCVIQIIGWKRKTQKFCLGIFFFSHVYHDFSALTLSLSLSLLTYYRLFTLLMFSPSERSFVCTKNDEKEKLKEKRWIFVNGKCWHNCCCKERTERQREKEKLFDIFRPLQSVHAVTTNPFFHCFSNNLCLLERPEQNFPAAIICDRWVFEWHVIQQPLGLGFKSSVCRFLSSFVVCERWSGSGLALVTVRLSFFIVILFCCQMDGLF